MPKKVDVNPKNPPDFPDTIDDVLPYLIKHEDLLDRMLEVGTIILITNGCMSIRDKSHNLVYSLTTSLMLGLALTYMLKQARGSQTLQAGLVAGILAIIALPALDKFDWDLPWLEEISEDPLKVLYAGPLGVQLWDKAQKHLTTTTTREVE